MKSSRSTAPYTVHQLAELAKVSVRTLHYYDQVGLLTPARIQKNGYRQYEERELLKLQQILFFRELEFSIEDIKKIMTGKHFDMGQALQDHKALLTIKKKRLDDLLKTIDKTINRLTKETHMNDTELYDGFTKEEAEAYAKEAKERWGNTDAYKQSQERYKKMSKDDIARIKKDGDVLLEELARNIDKAPGSEEVQALIAKHYEGLRSFYDPSPDMYKGLGDLFVDDERYGAYFVKFHPNLPVFMRDAMHVYADTLKQNGVESKKC